MHTQYALTLEAIQFLPPVYQERLAKMTEAKAKRNPRFRNHLDAAKSKKVADDEARDEWLMRCAKDIEAYHMTDVPSDC